MLYPINFALVNAARSTGFGLAGAKRFCANMGLNAPPKAWYTYQNILRDRYEQAAKRSMFTAIQEAMEHARTKMNEWFLSASFDGSWMKRGHASLAGFVSCISMYTNKVLGIGVRHKYCATCKGKSPCKKGDKCSINHKGSSGAMEPACTVDIVQKIYEDTDGFEIGKFLSDGDSRAFKEVDKVVPWDMVKLECVNHVAKGMGTRLRDAVTKGKHIDVFPGSGQRTGLDNVGRLTQPAIKKIQSFYNFIVHELKGDPVKMSEWVLAMYDHISSSNEAPKHDDCDIRFCKYLQAQQNGEPYDHNDKKHFHIPLAVMKHVETVFHDKADIDLLARTAHGLTQNANECFNSTVWNIAPKNVFANRELVELAVYMAVCRFNEGLHLTLKVLQGLHFPIGKDMAQRFKAMDQKRINKSINAVKDRSNRRRRQGANEAKDDSYVTGKYH